MSLISCASKEPFLRLLPADLFGNNFSYIGDACVPQSVLTNSFPADLRLCFTDHCDLLTKLLGEPLRA